jgi:hypothetical protein
VKLQTWEILLDPFAGSGSTCVAAALCGRRFMGVELDADYHRLAVARLAELAQRQSSGPRDLVGTLNAFASWAQTRGFTLPKHVIASALRRSLSTQATIKSPPL